MSDSELIECVQQFDVVWNKKDPNHKNKLIVRNAWNAIGEALNLSADVCEQKFLNIRHRYAKERRMLLNNTRSGSGAYVSRWPHFEACSFLDNVILTRMTKSNFQNVSVTSRDSTGNLKDSATAKFPATNFRSCNETVYSGEGETLNIITEDISQQTYDKVMSLENVEKTILDVDINNSELSLHDVFQLRHSHDNRRNHDNRHSYDTKISEAILSPSSNDIQTRPLSRATSISQTSSVSAQSTSGSKHAAEKRRNSKEADQNVLQLTNTIAGAFDKFEQLMKSSQHCEEIPLELSDEDFAFGRTVALALKHISSNKRKLILKSKILSDIANAADEF